MSRYVSAQLRKLVAKRANYVCEYCLAYEGHAFVKFQIEHIISIKHHGLTVAENLAYSCFLCNNTKGSDVGTILDDDNFVRFFNPRKDTWIDHFEISGSLILPKSKIGSATIKILDFNKEERLFERQTLLDVGYFPHPNTFKILGINP